MHWEKQNSLQRAPVCLPAWLLLLSQEVSTNFSHFCAWIDNTVIASSTASVYQRSRAHTHSHNPKKIKTSFRFRLFLLDADILPLKSTDNKNWYYSYRWKQICFKQKHDTASSSSSALFVCRITPKNKINSVYSFLLILLLRPLSSSVGAENKSSLSLFLRHEKIQKHPWKFAHTPSSQSPFQTVRKRHQTFLTSATSITDHNPMLRWNRCESRENKTRTKKTSHFLPFKWYP